MQSRLLKKKQQPNVVGASMLHFAYIINCMNLTHFIFTDFKLEPLEKKSTNDFTMVCFYFLIIIIIVVFPQILF